MDAGLIVALFIIFIVVLVINNRIKEKKRREYLLRKYGDAEVVAKILNGYFWQGQTANQLLDSLGRPLDIDKKVFKTKRKEVWKYNSRGRNRYGLRITLENDIVVGWDNKS